MLYTYQYISHIYAFVYLHVYFFVCVYILFSTCMSIFINVCMYVYIKNINICVCLLMDAYMYTC